MNRLLSWLFPKIYRDAMRYRWLRAGNAYRPEEWGCTGGQQLDDWIDEELAG